MNIILQINEAVCFKQNEVEKADSSWTGAPRGSRELLRSTKNVPITLFLPSKFVV